MQTDIPLKRLTRLCPTDLLPLFGITNASVVEVETLELPASASRLDTVLRLRDQTGHTYLHLIEWQGFHDPHFLWRTMGYLAWLGQHRPERPILATVIYLKPGDDSGDTLAQLPMQVGGWQITLSCVRLWEQDAAAAVATGAPGLLALAPLMQGANANVVEQAAQALLRTSPPLQSELLVTLGIFAAPIFNTERFIRLVTKERLMASDLITYLMEEKTAELLQEKAVLTEEKAVLAEQKAVLAEEKAVWQSAMQQAVEDLIIARFPAAPAVLTRRLHTITNPLRLQALLRSILEANDLTEVERLVVAAQNDAK